MGKFGSCEVCQKYRMDVAAVGIYRVPLLESEGSGYDNKHLCLNHATDFADGGRISDVVIGMGLPQIRLRSVYVETAN